MTPGEPNASDTAAAEGDNKAPPVAKLELLAPAGDEAALHAALEAGADAVYLGLTVLNARRRARNFTGEQLPAAVAAAHAQGARAYLTLNIDLAERELELAARALELARRAGFDAVLVRDPALQALHAAYPEIELHFSTQSCVTNSADVAAAAHLGASRAVLARELSFPEIAAAGRAGNLKTEVFVQGALCFCVSGRCLLSSWVGGRSGNRGACASPCRVPWSVGGEPAGTPLSMRDLSAVDRLEELRQAGVAAVKIEGRMKNANWVRRAVSIYRRALDGQDPVALRAEAEQLGAYTGRQMTSGYLDGQRDDLTAVARRQPAVPDERAGDFPDEGTDESAGESPSDRSTFNVEVYVQTRGVEIRCECGAVVDSWTIPRTVVHRPHKAVAVEKLFERLAAEPLHGCSLGRLATNEPEFLLVPRAVNAVIARISKTVQRGLKSRNELPGVELTDEVKDILARPTRWPGNQTPLGGEPDRARLERTAVEEFLAEVRPRGVIVEGVAADQVKSLRARCGRTPLIVALPPVFFEAELDDVRSLIRECARAHVPVEVNSWGGWWLAKQAGARIESGPGLPVLNSLAARVLARHGAESVTLSPEADRRQLEELAAHCPVPCSLVVFGRPPLMISRVEPPPQYVDTMLVDRRDTRLITRREGGLWVLRPEEPFDLRNIQSDRIRVKRLVVDLVGSPDPVHEWVHAPPRGKPSFHFNFERGLN